ncbi:LysR family transcriptional regulator [Rhodopseudomonas boonkerdii]|uniref:LysR family transcriptional regulator n=1 Tax=Rhodopseudomonas boonkerdii TaxID=475937 RepID=UPI001E463946|nr:LysR family transcriptional regulator [Rhodopseudomonas boonkerdii]UGV28503.1 LysR family transcriptional regulator [Rhodopseudomonas boonkerdii]
MAKNIDIGLLRAFVTVADCHSMTSAARSLNLSQGAVSQQVARLEAICRHPLFIRDRRGMKVTPFGDRLFDRACKILAIHDEIWSDIDDGAIAGTVRLGVPFDLAGAYLAPILTKFTREFPQVDVSLVCNSSPILRQLIRDNDLELAIVEEPIGSFDGERLAIQPLVWAGARAGKAYLKSPLPISMVTETCGFRAPVLDAMRRSGRQWRTVFEGGSLDATVAMGRSDLAVTIWLASAVPTDLDVIPSEAGLPALPSFAINLYRTHATQSPAAIELARYIQRETL